MHCKKRLRFRLDTERRVAAAAQRLGLSAQGLVARGSYRALTLGYEALQFLVARGRLSHPGRPLDAALALPGVVPQEPTEHRVYWSDPATASLVGLVMGLDLIRNGGKYYLVEVNINAGLLYESTPNPLVTALVENAVRHGFKRLVLLRMKGWPETYLNEFRRASATHGVPVVGVAMQWGTANGQPELGCQLEPGFAYHLFSNWHPPAPAVSFLHDKWSFGQWTRRLLDREPHRFRNLAYIPTFREPLIPADGGDPRFPNLVLKLTASDKGQHVAMGRFRDSAEALRGFGISENAPRTVPAVFRLSLRQRLRARLEGGTDTIFQPFVVPDTVAGRSRVIRLNVFLSPLYDLFLSAHSKAAPIPLPKRHPEGLTMDYRPYLLNLAKGANYSRLEPNIEAELVEVAAEFGELVRTALRERFEIGPINTSRCGRRSWVN